MPFRTITIKEEAYQKLRRAKRTGESFSDVVSRLAGGRSLHEWVGILAPGRGEMLARRHREIDREYEAEIRRRFHRR